jgi:membrane-bound lytic murein transglycosylase D
VLALVVLLLAGPPEPCPAIDPEPGSRPAFSLPADRDAIREAERILRKPRRCAELRRAARLLDGELSVVRRELAAHGVPEELAALAFVESKLRNVAEKTRRRGPSAGIFMLGPSTARAYGLRVGEPRKGGGSVDERYDVRRCSRAAARILRDLHRRWKDWRMVLIAWNRGEGKLRRAVAKAGSRDYEVLRENGLSGRFPVKVLGTALAFERLSAENREP